MPFVVDAWVALCWLMPDERDPVAEAAAARIVRDPAIVPGLWWFEVRNALLVNERRGRFNDEKTSEALRLLKELPIMVDNDIDEESLMRLSRTHGLTAYDDAYLEVSKRNGLTLATLDRALASAARTELVELISGGV